MTTETTETEIAVCPFCFDPMTAEPDAWRCESDKMSFPRCPRPSCGMPLVGKSDLWCAWCRKWFDEKLEAYKTNGSN